MKRKTTVTLTLTALLGLAGILYAANHSFFSAVQDPTFAAGPVGVAAAPADLIVSEYCTNTTLTNIDKVDCQGGFATIAQLHTFSGGGCQELYMTIAPNSAANAIPAPFSPRDYFVTSGPNIWQLRLPNPPTLFTMIPDGGCTSPGDHTGITFDHEGTFNFNLLVTCKGSGGVWGPALGGRRGLSRYDFDGPRCCSCNRQQWQRYFGCRRVAGRGSRPCDPAESLLLLLGRRTFPSDHTR